MRLIMRNMLASRGFRQMTPAVEVARERCDAVLFDLDGAAQEADVVVGNRGEPVP
jgi:hypothetical protein